MEKRLIWKGVLYRQKTYIERELKWRGDLYGKETYTKRRFI